ncbi:hypothetical protein [Sphingosinicella sp.]|uniref:hypothetical protein n=1 Tax=Sphingosinicella sp. TaxID=1917971 RepID=UPI0040381788
MRIATASPLLLSLFALPVQAQIVGHRDYGPTPAASPFLPDSRLPGAGIGREAAHLRNRIDRARDAGLISRREARRLDREARLIGAIARRYARNGLSGPERRELENRTRILDGAISAAPLRR